MPRANRYFLPGYVWHLTHRCHKGEYLLKFVRDRREWIKWLFEARKRFGLIVFNYMVTSNHIHLLAYSGNDANSIPQAMQLIAGRTAQQFNSRKKRTGAFWEDRYHATAVERGEYLRRCMIYIDLNMVRAGVVDHPRQWECCGYHELQDPPQRYVKVDRTLLAQKLDFHTSEELARWQRETLGASLEKRSVQKRCPQWTDSIAVGSEKFTANIQNELGVDGQHRMIHEDDNGCFSLREQAETYNAKMPRKIETLSCQNALPWKLTC